jgi:hypothetical protein
MTSGADLVVPGPRRRWLGVGVSSIFGVSFGIFGDFVRNDISIGLEDVVISLVLSPLAVTFGGYFAAGSWVRVLFLFGGLMFWPGYALGVYYCVKKQSLYAAIAVGLWCAQGFYCVVHRFLAIMSV